MITKRRSTNNAAPDWNCPQCTFLNQGKWIECKICLGSKHAVFIGKGEELNKKVDYNIHYMDDSSADKPNASADKPNASAAKPPCVANPKDNEKKADEKKDDEKKDNEKKDDENK